MKLRTIRFKADIPLCLRGGDTEIDKQYRVDHKLASVHAVY
jgi:hypothetical protein